MCDIMKPPIREWLGKSRKGEGVGDFRDSRITFIRGETGGTFREETKSAGNEAFEDNYQMMLRIRNGGNHL